MTAYVVGDLIEFNISWLRGGHAVLNIGDLSIEASERLGSLLDQLRFPTVQSISNLATVVLINRYVAYFNNMHLPLQFFSYSMLWNLPF